MLSSHINIKSISQDLRVKLTSFESHWDDIQYHHFNSLLCKKSNNMSANSTSTSSNQHNLFIPMVFIIDPIIQNFRIKVGRGPAEDTKVEKFLDSRGCCFVEDSEVRAFLGVSSEEDEEESSCRVESCSFQESHHRVAG